jgi:hypothetical protein
MRTTNNAHRLLIALTAVTILAIAPSWASAEEPYQRVTVDELKRIQKHNEEEQRRLEATPEYQEKMRLAEAARKKAEHDAYVAKERETHLQLEAAQLEHQRLENQRMANPESVSYVSSGGTGGVVVAPGYYNPGYFNYVPRLAVRPFPVHVVRPVIRFRR